MAIDPTIPLMSKGIDSLKMIEDGSQLAQLWQAQKTDGELNRIYNESQGNLSKMLDMGKQSKLARFVVPQIQSQITAQNKSYTDQLKTEADIAKTSSEAFKNNQQGQGFGVDNSQKKLGAINQAITAGAMTGDKSQILLGLDGLRRVGMLSDGDYGNYFDKLNALDSPEQIKQWASGVALMNSKDPASYLFQTKNNVADNQTSTNNNIRSTQASIYSTDVGAQTAANKLAQDGQQFQQNYALNQQKQYFEQNKPLGYETGSDGFRYAIYPNGKGIKVLGEDGQPIKIQGKDKGLTEQQSKDALFGVRMQQSNAILNDLEKNNVHQTVMSKVPWVGDSLSTVLPSFLGGANENQGKYMQARRDFINAVLRKESGAAIADSEFANAEKQYFPQVGDSKEIIAQKAKNRELATKMIIASSGEQGQQIINRATGNISNPPSVNSYSFMP